MGQIKSKTKDQKGSEIPDIPPESPLGIMIGNWNNRGPRKGKNKVKLVQYCMMEWPKKPLRPHVFWPVFGSFDDWICQALNIYVNLKEPFCQEESEYAELWVRTSRPASIFALKTKTKEDSGGEEKQEKEKNDEWEPLDNLPPLGPNNTLPAPPAPPPVPVISPAVRPRPPRPLPPAQTAPELDLPPAACTRSKTAVSEETPLYPLREVPLGGNQGGIGFVAVPLNTTEVRTFRKEMGTLLNDPLGVAEKLDQFLGPNTYTWEEIQSILGILFTAEERGMIRQAGMRIWERQNQAGPPGDQKWPNVDPHWDHQQPQGRQNMRDLRTIIIQGIREAVPRGKNINKAFNEHQGKEEPPTEWLERLKKSLQMYSGIDPNTAIGTALLRTQFVAKSWGDIRRKLEKLENWQERGLEELLREAQKVYVRRDEEKQKTKAKIFVAAIKESQKKPLSGEREKRRSIEEAPRGQPSQGNSVIPACYYCQKKGHLQKNCRKREQDEKMFKEE
uniref:CCHC-type domain-containing protein n=1 Tax=Anas platyrhynchos TaxID=8839 RepID=A0A8B9QQS2_ANAPL